MVSGFGHREFVAAFGRTISAGDVITAHEKIKVVGSEMNLPRAYVVVSKSLLADYDTPPLDGSDGNGCIYRKPEEALQGEAPWFAYNPQTAK